MITTFPHLAAVAHPKAKVLAICATADNAAGVLSGPGRYAVFTGMLGATKHLKIAQAIISLVSVYMVNYLGFSQFSSEILLHQKAMLKTSSPVWESEINISLRYKSASLSIWFLNSTYGISSALLRAIFMWHIRTVILLNAKFFRAPEACFESVRNSLSVHVVSALKRTRLPLKTRMGISLEGRTAYLANKCLFHGYLMVHQ